MTEGPDKDILEQHKIQWQWYADYDREDEYEKNPDWAADMQAEEVEAEDEYDTKFKFFDKFDPEHMWIKSDTTVNLIANR